MGLGCGPGASAAADSQAGLEIETETYLNPSLLIADLTWPGNGNVCVGNMHERPSTNSSGMGERGASKQLHSSQ